jgi:hypothetical protein
MNDRLLHRAIPALLRLALIAVMGVASVSILAQTAPYDIGSPVTTDVWINPSGGSDANDGATSARALRTLTEAWNRIPQGTTLTRGFRLMLMPGVYREDAIPNYLESRYGTAQAPIIIQSAAGARSAHLAGDLNVFDTRYLYLIGLDIVPDPPGDAFHCERCDHILIRGSNLDGGDRQAHDMLKVNQSRYVYIEESTLAGADDNTIDFVAVQYGHVLRNRISNAQDWCMYAKGGSAYLRIEGNEFFSCGTGGFTAGQGTGSQFMDAPWIHYEAYDIKVVNNVVHDTEGAGLGVNGGYNILLAFNTLYNVGERDHMLEVTFGNRSCDGQPGDPGREACQANLSSGGWGTAIVDDGENYVRIPSRNVFIYNNVLYNPPGHASAQIFSVPPSYAAATQNGSNVPVPAAADTNLQIRGNVIFNGGFSQILGIEEEAGCANANPTCNASQLRSENTIGTVEPLLTSPSSGNFHPAAGSPLFGARTFAIPSFTWADAPPMPLAPVGDLANLVSVDRDGSPRTAAVAGAYTVTAAVTAKPARRRAVAP